MAIKRCLPVLLEHLKKASEDINNTMSACVLIGGKPCSVTTNSSSMCIDGMTRSCHAECACLRMYYGSSISLSRSGLWYFK